MKSLSGPPHNWTLPPASFQQGCFSGGSGKERWKETSEVQEHSGKRHRPSDVKEGDAVESLVITQSTFSAALFLPTYHLVKNFLAAELKSDALAEVVLLKGQSAYLGSLNLENTSSFAYFLFCHL